jgi:hypothetical protein
MKALRLLLLLSAAGLAAGCGSMKNLDPLGGLAGAADGSRYGFEGGTEGWAPSASGGGTCTGVFQATGSRFLGQASLGMTVQGLNNAYPANATCPGADGGSRASILYGAGFPDLAGKTVRAWLYIPAEAAYSTDAPTLAQIFLVDNGSSAYANGAGVNLVPGGWTEVTFSPDPANPVANSFYAAGFNAAAIKEIGVKLSTSGTAPCNFSFSGTVLLDAVSW